MNLHRIARAVVFVGVFLTTTLASRADAKIKTKFSSQLSFGSIYSPADVGQEVSELATPIELKADFSARFGKSTKLTLSPYLYSDPSAGNPREAFFADLDEASLEIKFFENSRASFGLNQVAWGVTDVFNPLDVVSQRRYFDPLDSDKRGVPSLILETERESWRVEGIYVPVQLESVLPGEKSRWLPRDVSIDRSRDYGTAILPPELRYSYLEKEVVNSALNHGFGGRLEYRGAGVDYSLIAFDGAASSPTIFPEITGTVVSTDPLVFRADPDVALRPVYYRRRALGASTVVTFETAILRLALANSDRLGDDVLLPGWSQSLVLGLEKNFALGETTLTLLLQGTYSRHEEAADNQTTSVERIFDRSAFLGMRYMPSLAWSLQGAVLHDFLGNGWFAQFKAEFKVLDGLSAHLGADIIDGQSTSPLGVYRRNDRVQAGFTLFH